MPSAFSPIDVGDQYKALSSGAVKVAVPLLTLAAGDWATLSMVKVTVPPLGVPMPEETAVRMLMLCERESSVSLPI